MRTACSSIIRFFMSSPHLKIARELTFSLATGNASGQHRLSPMEIHLKQLLMKRAALAAFLASSLLHGVTHAQAIGPDPTAASLAADGPFAVSTQTANRATGFAGGTIYVPNAAGKYALVAFCPGFTNSQSAVATLGRRLATHGFVVVTMNTNSVFDFPASRATQLIAALNSVAAISTGPIAGKVDATRRLVAGYSMGGGGTLIAARRNPSLRGAIALAPWSDNDKNFSTNTVPTTIVGGSADTTAPPSAHANVFYNSMPTTTKKLLAIINGATHSFPTTSTPNQPASGYQIAWSKRFADQDVRYSPFLVTDSRLSLFASTGPF
ncbi:alpha/beta hydrolase family protein [Roseateles sp.]|uniref:alpha/beta hydrolase family protein n=1 Tax=Roseateles sp. TaxID=1971397 RepID=UPI0037C898FE